MKIVTPDYLWIDYATCSIGSTPCGWEGWIIDAAYQETETTVATATGDEILPADYTQKCPICGSIMYREGVQRKYLLDEGDFKIS